MVPEKPLIGVSLASERERRRGPRPAGSVSSVCRSVLYPLPPSAVQRPSCHRHFAPLCPPEASFAQTTSSGVPESGGEEERTKTAPKKPKRHTFFLSLVQREQRALTQQWKWLWRFLIEKRLFPLTPPSPLWCLLVSLTPPFSFPINSLSTLHPPSLSSCIAFLSTHTHTHTHTFSSPPPSSLRFAFPHSCFSERSPSCLPHYTNGPPYQLPLHTFTQV